MEKAKEREERNEESFKQSCFELPAWRHSIPTPHSGIGRVCADGSTSSPLPLPQAGRMCSNASHERQSSLSTPLCPVVMHSILATAEAETNLELPCTWAAQGGSREVGVCPSWPMETIPGWCMLMVEVVGQETFPAQALVWLLLLEQDYYYYYH